MDRIEVRQSSILIHGYEMGECRTIERDFSIYDKIYHKVRPKGMYYDKESKILYLPRGLDVYKLEMASGLKANQSYKADPSANVSKIMLKYLPRNETQYKAIDFLLGQGKYAYTRRYSQLSVNLNTGSGKTYLAIAAASYHQVRTAMITSSINWIYQWRDRILEYTDTKPNEIYIVEGKSSIAKLINGVHDIGKFKFFLCSHRTISSYGDTYGWDKVGKLFKELKIGLKMYDEAHLYFDNICKIDFFTNTRQTIYITATPARSDTEENRVYKAAFKGVPGIDLFDEEEDPRTQYLGLHYSSKPSVIHINDCRSKLGFNVIRYIDYVVDNERFYKLLTIIMEIIRLKGKTLIYIGKISALEKVYEWLFIHYPEYRGDIGIYHSGVAKEFKESQLNKSIILSTVKSCGAAMDIKGLKCTVVLADPFKSEVLARQTLGRTRDRDTLYIEVVDRGFATLRRWYDMKKYVFDKYATKCSDVTLTDKKLEEKYAECYARRQAIQMELFQPNSERRIQIVY